MDTDLGLQASMAHNEGDSGTRVITKKPWYKKLLDVLVFWR